MFLCANRKGKPANAPRLAPSPAGVAAYVEELEVANGTLKVQKKAHVYIAFAVTVGR